MASGDCRCGHDRDSHRHYRRGDDCALCDCPHFRGESAFWGKLFGNGRGAGSGSEGDAVRRPEAPPQP